MVVMMSSLRDQLSQLGFESSAQVATDTDSDTQAELTPAAAGQTLRIQRQTKGRKGKGVTVVLDLNLSTSALQQLAKQLKQTCGVGGAVKDGTIELQGDQRAAAKALLEQQGYRVKFAGG